MDIQLIILSRIVPKIRFAAMVELAKYLNLSSRTFKNPRSFEVQHGIKGLQASVEKIYVASAGKLVVGK